MCVDRLIGLSLNSSDSIKLFELIWKTIFTTHCTIITSNTKEFIKETTHCEQITLMFIYYVQ